MSAVFTCILPNLLGKGLLQNLALSDWPASFSDFPVSPTLLPQLYSSLWIADALGLLAFLGGYWDLNSSVFLQPVGHFTH